MTCQDVLDRLSPLHDDELDPVTGGEVMKHLDSCPGCARAFAAQKDLGANQDSEVQSMANYTHARIAFDTALGRTLEANHIIMEEALSGRVQRESVLPPNLPASRTAVAK